MAGYPVHQATMHGEDLGTGVQPNATRTRYPVHRSMKSGGNWIGGRTQGSDLGVAHSALI